MRRANPAPSAWGTVARLGPELSLTRLCQVLVVWPASPFETLGSHSPSMMRNCLILVVACQLHHSVFLYCVVPGCPPLMRNFTHVKQNWPPHDAFRWTLTVIDFKWGAVVSGHAICVGALSRRMTPQHTLPQMTPLIPYIAQLMVRGPWLSI